MSPRGVLLAALAAAPLLGPLRAAPVEAGFRADAAHSGVYPASGGPALLGERWSVATRGPVRGSPTVSGGVVYAGSGDGLLRALDAARGSERWRADLGGAVASGVAVAEGLVFAASRPGRLTALDAATGRTRWKFDAGPDLPFEWGWDFWLSTPTAAGGAVYAGFGDGAIRAFDSRTGRQLWERRTSGRVRTAPAVSDGVVYAGTMEGKLYALDAATGAEKWVFATEGASIDSKQAGFDRTSIVSSPAVAADLVVVGSRDAHLYGVDRSTGRQRWRIAHPVESLPGAPEYSWVLGSPAVSGGFVYVGSSDGRFFQAVRAESGEEAWRFRTPKNVLSSGALSGGRLYFGCEDGHLFALDAASGRELWRFRTGGAVISSPAVSDGAVFFGSDDGRIYALETGAERAGSRPRRSVYWKDLGEHRWFRGDAALRERLESDGYERLDDSGLASRLSDLATAPRSVVVVATDALPPDATAGLAESPLVRWLAAGGRLVWVGLPVDCFERDPKTGQAVRYDPSRTTRLLGVRHEGGTFDWMGALATPEGRAWGVPDWYLASFAVAREDVTEVLGVDEVGMASAWVKAFGPVPGSGFVRVWGRETPIEDPSWVERVAEHRPTTKP